MLNENLDNSKDYCGEDELIEDLDKSAKQKELPNQIKDKKEKVKLDIFGPKKPEEENSDKEPKDSKEKEESNNTKEKKKETKKKKKTKRRSKKRK